MMKKVECIECIAKHNMLIVAAAILFILIAYYCNCLRKRKHALFLSARRQSENLEFQRVVENGGLPTYEEATAQTPTPPNVYPPSV